jgi:hypothetical protein
LGDPSQLVEDVGIGFHELFVITKDEIKLGGKSGFGRGVESFIRNAIGGGFDFLGRFTGSQAEFLEELLLSDVCEILLFLVFLFQ